MIVTVATRHFKSATFFSSNYRCPLAEAIKEQLGVEPMVGGFDVDINGKDYKFKGWSETIDCTINFSSLIAKAKAGEEVPSFEVEIIGYELEK